MPKVTTAECKQAIVAFVKANPGLISQQFVDPIDESPAQDVKNWKRMYKEREDGFNQRAFDCRPYDDQLRAYTRDDGDKITSVIVQGE